MRICCDRFVIALLGLAVVAGGCQSSQPQASQREEATQKWNAARAAVLASLAQDQFKNGNFDKCRGTVDDALRLTPKSATLHVLSAKLLIEKGQLEAAEQELKLARDDAPNDAEAHYLSGVVYQRWQKPQVAFDFYKSAAEKSPAELAYLLAESEMLVAMDRTPEALALLSAKVTYFEHSGVIRDAAGQLLQQLGRNGEAIVMFRQASVLSEDDASIRERLALALYTEHQYPACVDVLAPLLQKEAFAKRADLFSVLGASQLECGVARDARSSYETASNLEPNSAPIWRGLARAAIEAGDSRRAELSLARSLKLDPTSAEAHLLAGYVSLKAGKLAEALASFENARAIDPLDSTTLCMAGYVLEKMGRPGPRRRYYAKALQIKPGDDLAAQLMAGVDLHD